MLPRTGGATMAEREASEVVVRCHDGLGMCIGGGQVRDMIGPPRDQAALAAVLAACAGCTSGGSTTAATPAAPAGGVPLQRDYVNTIRQVLPSVVEIKTHLALALGWSLTRPVIS